MTFSNYKKYLNYENEQQKNYQNVLTKYNINHSHKDKYWIYCVNNSNIELKKGFKIHLSATILNAIQVTELFLEFVKKETLPINFKILANLKELTLQNSGVYGYSQVGKFITIYPNNSKELCHCLNKLEKIYKGMNSVPIPSDFRFKLSNIVFYRYGEFVKDSEFQDKRNKKIPDNIEIPIDDYFRKRFENIPPNYIVLEIIHKNAKGGIYKVLNTESKNITILKEATYLALMDFTKIDSVDRLINEKNILSEIRSEGFVPKVLTDFYVKNSYFLEMEYIEGYSLFEYHKMQTNLKWFLKLLDCLEILNERYGYSYRDLSFNNIIINKHNDLFIIDFEHSIKKETFELEERVSLFGTPGFYETNLDSYKEPNEDIIGLVYLLFWSQNIAEYQTFIDMDYHDALKYMMIFEKERFNKINKEEKFYKIYEKAFKHKYNNFSELRHDFQSIMSESEVK